MYLFFYVFNNFLDCGKLTPLMKDLEDRSIERMKRREKIAEEEKSRLEQEELIRKQIEV